MNKKVKKKSQFRFPLKPVRRSEEWKSTRMVDLVKNRVRKNLHF